MSTGTAQFVLLFWTLLSFFCVALFWSLYGHLGRRRSFLLWTWAWAAYGMYYGATLVQVSFAAPASALEHSLVLLQMLAVYARAPLLFFGAWCYARGDRLEPPLFRAGVVIAMVAGVALGGLSLSLAPEGTARFVRNVPRALLAGAALLYTAVVFFQRWRATGSLAAVVTALATGVGGLINLSFLAVRPLRSSLDAWAYWSALEWLSALGIALGMVYLLLEERQQAAALVQASDERYRAFIEQSTEGIWRDELDRPVDVSAPADEQVALLLEHSRVAEANDAMARMYGCVRADELIGKPLRAVLDPAKSANIECLLRYIRNGYRLVDGVTHETSPDGEPKVFLNNLVGIVQDGRLLRTWGTQRDITERTKAERALTEQRAFLRQVLDLNPSVIFARDRAGRFRLGNQAAAASYATTVDGLVGRTDRDFRRDEAQIEHFLAQDRSVLDTGAELYIPEERVTDDSGATRWLQTIKRPMRSADRQSDLVLVVTTDITDRKRAEQLHAAVYSIAQATDRVERLADLYPAVHDIIKEVMSARNFYIALHDESTGLLSFPYFVDERDAPPRPRRRGRGLTEYVLRTGRPLLCTAAVWDELARRGEVDAIGADSQVWVGVPLTVAGATLGVMAVQDYQAAAVYGEREMQVLGFVSSQVAQAIQRKRHEADLMRAAGEWMLTFDAIDYPILILDADLVVRRVNSAVRRLTGRGYPEVLGRPLETLGEGPLWTRCAALAVESRATGRHCVVQVRDEPADRTWEVEVSTVVEGSDGQDRVIVVIHDLTPLVRLQRSLQRSETLSTMGTLVVGVAHEVRNPLFGMTATLDAFEARFPQLPERPPHLAVLRAQLNRLTTLMQDLLDYGTPRRLELAPTPVRAVVEQAVEHSAGLTGGAEVRVDHGVGDALPPVMVDRFRMAQVFGNLIANAVQHSPAGAPVTIDAAGTSLDGHRWVEFVVADRGPGFTEEDLSHVFEPFYTRRRGGTGLGLAIVQRIVEQHGGRVAAANRAGGGAAITVRLPAALRAEMGG